MMMMMMTMTPQPIPVIPLEYEHPAVAAVARPSRALRVSAILAWAACMVAWGLLACVDVETVIVTGPIIALLGGMVAVRGIIERRAGFTVLGAAHLGICLLFVVLVNLLRWSPREAFTPFTVMGAMHVLGSGLGSAWMMMPSHWRQRARI
jgi:hypothetical protein